MARRQDNRGVAPYCPLPAGEPGPAPGGGRRARAAGRCRRAAPAGHGDVGRDSTSDLRQATVYLSSLSEDAAAALDDRRVQVQRAVARQTQLKRTPQLSFAQDPAVVAGSRVEDLLRQIHDPTTPPDGWRPTDGTTTTSEPAGRRTRSTAWWWWTRRPGGRPTTSWRAAAGSSARSGSATPAPSTPTPPGSSWSGSVGRTRLMRFLTALPKTYEAEVVLGTATSTLDASGDVTGTWDMEDVSLAAVREAAAALTGEIEQVPPMVSARQGRRAAAARAGPRGHRGRAGGPSGHRPPVRRHAGHDPGRVPDRGGVLVGHLRPGAGGRPRARPSAGAPTCATCAAPASARSPPRTPGWSTS